MVLHEMCLGASDCGHPSIWSNISDAHCKWSDCDSCPLSGGTPYDLMYIWVIYD